MRAMLRQLRDAGIDFVLTGSVAAVAYGVAAEPNDLDIAPSPDSKNLSRLAEVLGAWRAKPHFEPGRWPEMAEEDCEQWTPEPASADNLDHLYETAYGLFDVVPWRSGTYEELAPRALPASLDGHHVLVAAPCDLIPHLRLHKEKHQLRAPYLEELCLRTRRGESVTPSLDWLEAA